MQREQRYQDTTYFKFYNANPKAKYTSDCVIRALSTAMQKPYNEVVVELANMQCQCGYDVGDPKLYNKYLAANGWKRCKQPRKDDNKKYTGVEWCKFLQFWNNPEYSRMIANIGSGHIVAIVDGKIFDTWDSYNNCIGNYWIKDTYVKCK